MHRDKLLEILCDLLGWDDDDLTFITEERKWLFTMAVAKYDGYRDFQAGSRFLESLVAWLQQFKTTDDRKVAYSLVRSHLIYISPPELQRLIEMFYPNHVEKWLRNQIATNKALKPYEVALSTERFSSVKPFLRRALIMGLSDGARIDAIRHSTVGKLSNEQFVLQTQVDKFKWANLGADLKDDVKDDNARFSCVFLVDDFMGTGTSFLRYDDEKKVWKGRLTRFRQSIETVTELFESPLKIHVHHYLSREQAAGIARTNVDIYIREEGWDAEVELTFGHIIPGHLCFSQDDSDPAKQQIIDLAGRYYNNSIETKHTEVGGCGVSLGYGSCGLPLVLDHNTPNNSLALLWAESGNVDKDGVPAHEMRPLFRRRQRHT